MTHIIIHNRREILESYLLDLLSKLLSRDIKLVDLDRIPDIHVLRKTGSSIGIDEVKEVQKDMIFKPFELQYQIAIIMDSQFLTDEAQNAFLKTLEESSDFSIYILLLNNERNLLPTILSRGTKHYIKAQKEQEIEHLRPEILDNELADQFQTIEIMAKEKNDDLLIMLNELANYFRELLRKDIQSGGDVKESLTRVELVNTAIARLKANGNKRLVVENLFIQLSLH